MSVENVYINNFINHFFFDNHFLNLHNFVLLYKTVGQRVVSIRLLRSKQIVYC